MDTIHKTYLALGDSYTIGESVADTERFPVLTVKLLREQNIDISNPAIIAVTGWTTTNLLNALDNNPPPKKTYSFVSLLIGVNNQYQGRSLDKYKTRFAELLARAISHAGNNKNHDVLHFVETELPLNAKLHVNNQHSFITNSINN